MTSVQISKISNFSQNHNFLVAIKNVPKWSRLRPFAPPPIAPASKRKFIGRPKNFGFFFHNHVIEKIFHQKKILIRIFAGRYHL